MKYFMVIFVILIMSTNLYYVFYNMYKDQYFMAILSLIGAIILIPGLIYSIKDLENN